MTATQVCVVEDARGYGEAVVKRLVRALEENAAMWRDPRHPRLLVVETSHECFYIAPLSPGKVVLLGHWQKAAWASRERLQAVFGAA